MFPCNIEGSNVNLTSEVVEVDFSQLVGNTEMEGAGGALFWVKKEARFLGKMVPVHKTTSGHYTLKIDKPEKNKQFVSKYNGSTAIKEETIFMCVLMKEKKLTLKEIELLHHQFGHGKGDKVAVFIVNAGKMTDEVKGFVKKVKEESEACKLDAKQKPLSIHRYKSIVYLWIGTPDFWR